MRSPRATPVVWTRALDAFYQYTSAVRGRRWVLRLGEFPAEPLYTLVVDGVEIESFDDWPSAWSRPEEDRT